MQTSKKTCFKCRETKPLTGFYRHKGMKDGHLNKCKTCARAESTQNRNRSIERYRNYDRERGNRQTAKDTREYRKGNPEKQKCHAAVARAVKAGKLNKPDRCERCGSQANLEGHHEDYTKPLDVIWLCSICHRSEHKEKPMQDLKLKTQLPAISFDFDGLKKWAEGIAAQYADVVVREEDVPEIKNEMAALNKVKDGLNKARIATKKKVSEPIAAFEAQVKELVGIIDNARSGLDEQVKAHVQKLRDQKRKEVEFMIEELKSEHDVHDLDIPFNDSWSTKSAAMKTTKAEIEAMILEHMRREKERAQLEQAKKDRAVAVEQNCQKLEADYGVTIKPSEFLHLLDIDIPLADVNDKMVKAFAKKASTNEKPSEPQPVKRPTPPMAPPKASSKRTLTVTLEYLPHLEGSVRKTLDSLRSMGVIVNTHDPKVAA